MKKKNVIIAGIVTVTVATGVAIKKYGGKAVGKVKGLFSKKNKSEDSEVVETTVEEVKTEE